MSNLEQLELDNLPLNGNGDGLTNLITNPSAEVNLTGWTVVAGAWVRDPSQAVYGSASFKATAVGNRPILATNVTLVAGGSYRFMVWCATSTLTHVGGAGLNLDMVSGSGATFDSVTLTGSTGWTLLFATVTGASPGAVVAVQLDVGFATTGNGVAAFDGVFGCAGTTLPDYFDGDSPGYYWTGTPYASASTSTPFQLESFSNPPAAKKPEWIGGADADGALLARDPRYENGVKEIRLGMAPQSSMNAALAAIGLLEDKLQECSRNANGLALVWAPADSTIGPVTYRCLAGEITDMPISWEGGWLSKAPTLGLRLTCLPLALGSEVLAATTTGNGPLQTVEVAGAAGDVPALARIVVTDGAAQGQRDCRVGLESRWYPVSGPPSLLIDSASMITAGYTGVTATRSGAYSGGSNNVIRATLRTHVQRICGLGSLTHVGNFRPQLRYWASATTIAVRLTYKSLDGPERSLSYTVPVTAGWNCVDLGSIGIPIAVLGSQRWNGYLEAYSTASGGETFDADVVMLLPAEAFGRARAAYAYKPGVLTAYDDFTGTIAGASLTGRAAPFGGNWATSGALVDYWFEDYAGGESITRTATGIRYAILNPTGTDTEVSVLVSSQIIASDPTIPGVIARWGDANNYLRLQLLCVDASGTGGTTLAIPTLVMKVAGVETTLASGDPLYVADGTPLTLRIVCYASGFTVATVLIGTGIASTLITRSTVLAGGGLLQTGSTGIYDAGVGSSIRHYDEFCAGTPAPEPIACYASQSIEFRHDGTLRKDSTGVYAGRPPEVIGPSSWTIPNAGGPGRKTRVAVMMRRNDTDTLADDFITDSATVDVYVTPRYLAVPR